MIIVLYVLIYHLNDPLTNCIKCHVNSRSLVQQGPRLRKVWNVTILSGARVNVSIEGELLDKDQTADQAFSDDLPSVGHEYDCYWKNESMIIWGPSYVSPNPFVVFSAIWTSFSCVVLFFICVKTRENFLEYQAWQIANENKAKIAIVKEKKKA